MKSRFDKKILLFVYDGLPTENDYTRMDELMLNHKANVHFRNGSCATTGSLEEADYYAGLVPAEYAAAFPAKVIDADGNIPETAVDTVSTENQASGGEGKGVSSLATSIGSAPKGKWPGKA